MSDNIIYISGIVSDGRGLASQHLEKYNDKLSVFLDSTPQPGSLNIFLNKPLQLSIENGFFLDQENKRMVWKASIDGKRILLYRWHGCPLSIIEIISNLHLRKELKLMSNDSITIEIPKENISTPDLPSLITWIFLWKGRSHLFYSTEYGVHASYFQRFLNGDLSAMKIKKNITNKIRKFIPENIRKFIYKEISKQKIDFSRKKPRAGNEGAIDRVINILSYTKTSGSPYSAQKYPAGYHTLFLDNEIVAGQRLPSARLDLLPIPLNGLSVLDIGCNQGGMLFEASRRGMIWGVGVDFDPRMINAANKTKQYTKSNNIDFFVFNLEKEDLSLIEDFLPNQQVDIVFLLSVCMWIENWQELIVYCSKLSPHMLFETNGSDEQQDSQERCLRLNFSTVSTLQMTSEDDENQKRRRLYFCSR